MLQVKHKPDSWGGTNNMMETLQNNRLKYANVTATLLASTPGSKVEASACQSRDENTSYLHCISTEKTQ